MIRVYLSANGDPVHDKCLEAAYQTGKSLDGDIQMVSARDYHPSDVAVVFGVGKKAIPFTKHRARVIAEQKSRNLITVIIDSGYVRRDEQSGGPYFSVGLNGLNGWADFKNEGMPDDRWRDLGIELKPWKKGGECVVLCGQVPWDASVQHTDHINWLAEAACLIQLQDWGNLVFRPHPKAQNIASLALKSWCDEISFRPLEADLERARAFICYNSNSGVDAIINGVPVIGLGEGDMYGDMASRDAGELKFEERARWAADLAYTQWRPDQFDGAWKHLFGG